MPGVIKNTTIFLKRLKQLGVMPEGVILCCMDVIGLYPHITHKEGLETMKKAIEKFLKAREQMGLQCGADDMKELASIILGKNFSTFEGKIYKQRMGTVIGTKSAAAFANIFMSKLDKRMLEDSCGFRTF